MTTAVSNQLKPDLLGTNSLQPWPGTVSASRAQMFGSHLGQSLVIEGSTERRTQTGMEAEFGKYTLSVKMPCNGRIIKIITRHKQSYGKDSLDINPETVVIFENDATKEIDVLVLTNYCTFHQYIGFQYKPTKHINDLVVGKYIAEGKKFLDSPSVTEDGGYKYGIELNTVFMTHPAVAEDGILICSDVLPKLRFKTYETRVVEWGSKYFPLNIYGDDDNFKAFPEIGEIIRDDGLLCALRTHDDSLAAVEQSLKSLKVVDAIFDRSVYVPGGGRVVDVKITRSDNGIDKPEKTMEDKLKKYETARHSFYKEIISEWRRLKHTQGDGLSITPEFHRLVVEALAYTETNEKMKITKLYRKSPLDEYNLEFVIEYDVTPTIGYKLTDCAGGSTM